MLTYPSLCTMYFRTKENTFAVIFILPLECGLFRIFVDGQNAFKGGIATPLVSGTVVSRRALGKYTEMLGSLIRFIHILTLPFPNLPTFLTLARCRSAYDCHEHLQ